MSDSKVRQFDKLEVGDQVRMRRRGGAFPRAYVITDVLTSRDPNHRRLFQLEASDGSSRTAFEDDLVPVQQHAPHGHN
jgi:hypothetical protein